MDYKMDMANLNGKMVHFIEETIIMDKEKVMGNFIIPKIIVSVEVFGKKAFYKVKANMFNQMESHINAYGMQEN
jgi:hypothetical protein